MRDRKGVDKNARRGGKKFGGVERGESALRLCCMRKETMFNKSGGERT